MVAENGTLPFLLAVGGVPIPIGSRVPARGVLAAAVTTIAALAASATPVHADDGCPNAAIRSAQHTELPDCRAYERVSPADKAGFSVNLPDGMNYPNGSGPGATEIIRGGDGFAYIAGGAFGDPQGQDGMGIAYRALRGADGWSSVSVTAPFGPPAPALLASVGNPDISSDGTRSLITSPAALADGAWPCIELQSLCFIGNLYLQDNETGRRRLIAGLTHDGSAPLDATELAMTTPDLEKVLFTTSDALVPDAVPNVQNLYEWTDDGTPRGMLRLVGLGSDGRPLADGAVAGQGRYRGVDVTSRTLSADGRRIFFTSGGQLYVRQDGTTTKRVSASQRTTPDPDGAQPATYWTAESEHGASVFFASGEKLTDDAHATPAEPDLYRYDVATGALADVTASTQGAGVLGVIGASDDASTVYLAATAQLVPGKGEAGAANVYRWKHDGTPDGELSFVATIGTVAEATGFGALNWATPSTFVPPVQVSSDGRFLALLARRALTAHDTAGKVQAYRYDADTGAIDCVSCAPGGAPPNADADFRHFTRAEPYRVVSDRGDVAFHTEDAVLPADRNGVRDVYLYGAGGPRLVSTGADPSLSTLAGISRSGRDVFFSTREPLVADDADDLIDLYDARIGGGFASPAHPAPCEADACQGRPAGTQSAPDPASRTFSGPGNLPAPAKKRTTKKVRATATARGAAVRVRVQAPAAGRITVSGASLRTARKTVRKAQAVTVTVRLTTTAARRLARAGRLRLRAKVAFTPARGAASSTTVALTMKEQR